MACHLVQIDADPHSKNRFSLSAGVCARGGIKARDRRDHHASQDQLKYMQWFTDLGLDDPKMIQERVSMIDTLAYSIAEQQRDLREKTIMPTSYLDLEGTTTEGKLALLRTQRQMLSRDENRSKFMMSKAGREEWQERMSAIEHDIHHYKQVLERDNARIQDLDKTLDLIIAAGNSVKHPQKMDPLL